MKSIKMSNLEVKFMYEPSTDYVRSKYGGSTCHEKGSKKGERRQFILQNVSF